MPGRRLVTSWGSLSLVPAALLLGLMLHGDLDPAIALPSLVIVVLSTLAFAFRFNGELGRLAADAERLARTLDLRAGQAGDLLRANETIIDQLPDPLLVLSPDGRVLRTNQAVRTAFRDELPAVLRHPALRNAIALAAAGSAQSVALSLPVPVEREVQATIMPLQSAGQLLLVLSDRTRERRVEQMRADFVANVSHELRTPLASVVGFIETLQGPAADDTPARIRFLGIMAEQAERMRRLIDDLLSLSRIELVEHEPPADRVPLADLLRRVAASFEPRLPERQTQLTLRLASDLPAIAADADQIAQVATNLIENAMKYGRVGGHVQLSLALADGPAWPAGVGLVLAVSDDGPGIPRAHLPRLTERFYRVDKARSRNAGGTGLGLAIVKHIVNRHRGHLFVESGEGKGATFSVWLPIR